MDNKKRQALIKALADAENFDSNYLEPNRLWFLKKLIQEFESEGLSESDIEQRTREIVQKSKSIVKANCDFTLALVAGDNKRYTKRTLKNMRRQRVEILYGAIAFNRQFVEPQHLDYLLFVAKRRFHSICRMYFWVNPNPQGYFRYPHTCSADSRWRVNKDVAPFWESANPPKDLPIKLKPQGNGALDPVAALKGLFVKKSKPCEGNLLDCSSVASILFMASLLEAKDPDRLLKKLASKDPGYLVIHQLGFAPSPNFYQDATNEGVMRIIEAPAIDLQVGDHVYIYNHPLYKTFRPTGSWRGEHSLVYISRNRNYKSKNGFVFGGHGKEGTLYQFYDAFLAELKSHLAIARQLMVAHLAFMRGGVAAIAPGTVVEAEHNISVGSLPAVAFRLLEYDKTVEAKDYTKIPTKTKRKPKRTAPAFVIVQSKTEHVFYLDQVDKPDEDKPLDKNLKKTIAAIVASGKLSHPIKFRRLTQSPAGASPDVIYAIDSWGVAYLDRSTSTEKIWPFFETKDGKLKRKELNHDDLFQSPFQLFTKSSANLRVSQPKVDFGAGHQNFLTANGAF